ncbi:MAG TPA: hypothetical protein VJ698_18545 [Noviherbaspirillum sp.]|uniref:hypothetical protein n=1 Tax=Noviherbaspirillum sp. TaxID=1926288 RepID=UPI002B48CED6|nr:hypothetical protein [Noviherbaspirillum sp.]HJV87475.1 hypothetical protein [Noviherbaspirillum sp.]
MAFSQHQEDGREGGEHRHHQQGHKHRDFHRRGPPAEIAMRGNAVLRPAGRICSRIADPFTGAGHVNGRIAASKGKMRQSREAAFPANEIHDGPPET